MRKLVLTVAAIVTILIAGTTSGADLIAGNPKNGANVVGEVTVSQEDGFLVVKYSITENNVVLTETHLHIATSPDDIPQNNGNPVPGKFQYSDPHGSVTEWIYKIPLFVAPVVSPKNGKVLDPGHDWRTPGTELFIAAHGVANYLNCDVDLFAQVLPYNVEMEILRGPAAYYNGSTPARSVPPIYNPLVDYTGYIQDLLIGDTTPPSEPMNAISINGHYYGWCLDAQSDIGGHKYKCFVVSSYDFAVLESLLIAFPKLGVIKNLPLVNWIMNYVQSDVLNTGIIYGDIQAAIWMLMGDGISPNFYGFEPTLGAYDNTRTTANEIIAAASAESEPYDPENDYFIPGCGEYMGIIVVPFMRWKLIDNKGTSEPEDDIWDWVDYKGQPVIIPLQLYSGGKDTVWAGEPDPTDNVPGPEPDDGDGYKFEFPGDNWAMYFTFIVEQSKSDTVSGCLLDKVSEQVEDFTL